MNNKKGQVWVETIIYTLIAFVMISLVLFFASPKIGELQDKTVIDQSVRVMDDIDTIISSIGVPGNKRLVELEIDKGVLNINGSHDNLIFKIDSRHMYSQPGKDITHGSVIVRTITQGEYNLVTLRINYAGAYNITYQGKDELKTLGKSATPYKLFISNKGGDVTNIDFDIS